MRFCSLNGLLYYYSVSNAIICVAFIIYEYRTNFIDMQICHIRSIADYELQTLYYNIETGL